MRLSAAAGLVLGLLVCSAAPPASAAGKEKAKKGPKGAAAGPLETRTLFGLSWHDNWKAAVTKNRVKPREARPIFFLRILGDLANGT